MGHDLGLDLFNTITRKVAELGPAASAELLSDAALAGAGASISRPKTDAVELALAQLTDGATAAAFVASAASGWRDGFAAGAFLAAAHATLRFGCPTATHGEAGGLFDELQTARQRAVKIHDLLVSDADGRKPLTNEERGQLASAFCVSLVAFRTARQEVARKIYGDGQAADGEIARKVADAVGVQLKDFAANYPKPRKDKGGKHVTRPKRKSEYGKTAKGVADDFNKSRFVPERGARPMGGCTETRIKQWDLQYPDAEHPHPRWGYYANLRLRADLKNEYGEVLQNWARYWADYKIAFKEWRKAHPASRRESFRFTPMKKANGYNPEWIGRDENGTIYNAPKK